VLGLSSVAKGPAGLSVPTFAGDLWVRWAGPFAIVICDVSPLLKQNVYLSLLISIRRATAMNGVVSCRLGALE
jgi:hypothetical protein